MADKLIIDLEEALTVSDTDIMVLDNLTETKKIQLKTLRDFFGIKIEDDTNWDGVITTFTYDVSSNTSDATKLVWSFQDASDNNKQMLCEIDFPTATEVRVTFGDDFPPDAGTYNLVGR